MNLKSLIPTPDQISKDALHRQEDLIVRTATYLIERLKENSGGYPLSITLENDLPKLVVAELTEAFSATGWELKYNPVKSYQAGPPHIVIQPMGEKMP